VEVRDEYVADVARYSGPLREAAQDADRFKDNNDQAALAARRMGLAAKEAADKAARAQRDAAAAAEKLARSELQAGEAAKAAANAAEKLKNGEIKAAEAKRLAADAARKVAAADRAATRAVDLKTKATREAERAEISESAAARSAANAQEAMERAALKAAAAERAAAKEADKAAANFKQMARDAALGAAAENLAMLKASGSVRQHNSEVLRLRKEMPELGKDGSKAFTLMSSTSRRFGNALGDVTSGMGELEGVGRAVPSAILVGLQLLPAAASVAGGAITLGLGGALSFIGLKAQMANKDVQKSFHQTRAAISDDLHHISEPFHQTLLSISADAKRTWYGMSPALEGAFAKMAPAITRFSSAFGDSLRELNPAIDSIGTAFSRTLDSLGGRAPAIMNNLGTSIKAITDAVAANPDALPSFIQDVSELTRYAGDSIGVLIRYSSEIKNAFEVANAVAVGPIGDLALGVLKLTHVTRDSGSGFQVVERTFPTFAQQAIVAAAGARQLMTAQQAATLSSQQLKTALDALTGANQNSFDATTAYRQALAAANAQAKSNNAGINGMSKAAIANRQSLSSMAGAIRNVMQNSNPTSAAIATMRSRFISAAQGMGVSRSAAIALANKLLGVRSAAQAIPGSRSINLHDNASSVRSHIAALQASINQLHGKTVTVDYIERVHRTLQAERARADGGIDMYADGGMRRDLQPFVATRPTVLFGETETGGEAYIPLGPSKRARSTDLLEQVADMFGLAVVKPLADGMIEKYAKGKIKHTGMKGPSKAQLAAEGRVRLARARPEYLAAMASQKALESMRASIYGGFFRGGPSTPGSAHGTVVEHTTNVYLTVQGSVHSSQDIVKLVQRALITNRMPVSLPAGR